jgi:hypothetical protein
VATKRKTAKKSAAKRKQAASKRTKRTGRGPKKTAAKRRAAGARKTASRAAASRRKTPRKVASARKTTAKKAAPARIAAVTTPSAASPAGEVYGEESWREEELSAGELDRESPEIEEVDADPDRPKVKGVVEDDSEW